MKIYSLSSQIIATSITLSPSFNLIHLTPQAVLPIGLTSSSENCIALPLFVAINILSFQEVVLTQERESHSLTHKTFNQLALIFWTWLISSFFTCQLLVTKNKYLASSFEISIIAATSSPFCNHIKLITGCHFAILFVSGIS